MTSPSSGEPTPAGVQSEWKRVWERYLTWDDFRHTIQAHREERQPLFRLLESCIEASGGQSCKVLEVGAGTGIDSYLVAEMTGAQVYGSDVLPEAIKLSKKLGSYFDAEVEFFLDDATDMKIEDESFDVVFSQGVLEHFPDPSPAIREQIRILRPGGFLLIDVPQTFSFYSIHKSRAMKKGTWEYGWETHYSYRRLRRLGESFGLRYVDRGGYGFEGKRDGGLGYLRNMNKLLARKGIDRTRAYRLFDRAWERLWRWIEDTFGHLFLISVIVVFQKPQP